MAFHTVEDGPWPQGVTVAVYPVASVDVGSPIDTAIAQPDGTATFGGLTEGAQYTAVGSGGTQTFYATNQETRLQSALTYSTAPTAASSAKIVTKADPSGTYPDSVIFGNSNSFGFSGTGTPTGIYGALGVNYAFGDTTGGSNAPVLKTTQAMYCIASYYGPTQDDSMEGSSVFVGVKDTGTGFTQALPVTGFESAVQIEGSNHATNYMLAVGARVKAVGTAIADEAIGVKTHGWSEQSKGPTSPGSFGTWKGFYDELYNPAGSLPTSSLSFSGKNLVHSEQGFVLTRTGHGASMTMTMYGSGGGNPAMMSLTKPDGATVATVLDGAFTNLSRKMTTATAPSIAWIGRTIANANVPAGTQVLNYYGTGPYTVVMTAAATGTASGQTVTFTETDLIGIKVTSPATGAAAFEGYAAGASNPNFRVSRIGGVFSTASFSVRNSTMATDLVGMDTTGLRYYSATLEQTTVGAAGGASALPATPTKYLKIKDSAGTVLVIPAYAAV